MDFQFNCNQIVKVKLTKFGEFVLKERHRELDKLIQESGGQQLREFRLNVDENGYYNTQMWGLMETFGEYMGFTTENPFELDIILVGCEPIGVRR